MKYDWFASDLHFRHMKIIEFGRPFKDVDEHDDEIIRRWNAVVQPTDKCLILGDLAFNVGVPKVGMLNGRKWLLMGNHEHKPILEYLPYFEDVKAYGEDKEKQILFSHIPVHESQLERWSWNVHGHTHAVNLPDPRYINLSMEQIGYAPLSRDSLMEKLK